MNDFSEEALQALMNHRWPGNVRELRTAIEHGVVLSRADKIELKDLPVSVRTGEGALPGVGFAGTPAVSDLNVHEAEKQLIIRALKETNGNRTHAAKKIGMSRRSLHRKLHVYHLEEF